MTTPQELTHDTLIALQIAYDGTEAQDDVRMLISGYRALQTRHREAVKVLEEALKFTKSHVIGSELWYAERDDIRAQIEGVLSGKVSE